LIAEAVQFGQGQPLLLMYQFLLSFSPFIIPLLCFVVSRFGLKKNSTD
jgi:hypothetical protein